MTDVTESLLGMVAELRMDVRGWQDEERNVLEGLEGIERCSLGLYHPSMRTACRSSPRQHDDMSMLLRRPICTPLL